MSLINAIKGNAASVDPQVLHEELKDVLVSNEQIVAGFAIIRDKFVFTNKRLILIDVQGVSGRKVEYVSIPYSSIKYFSVETAGTFDLDAELKIYMTGTMVSKNLRKGIDIVALQRLLGEFVMNS